MLRSRRGKNTVGFDQTYLYENGGDEGSRTPVQNGLSQTSTSVGQLLSRHAKGVTAT